MLRRLISVGAFIGLAGCADGVGGFSMPSFPALPAIFGTTPDVAPTPKLALFSGDVTAVGPKNYCVDPIASKPAQGFAIFAPCVTLGVDDAMPAVSAIVTLQVGSADSATVTDDPAGLAAVLTSDRGPVILARGGDAETVVVQSVQSKPDRVTVYFTDEAPAFIEGAQEAEWRSFVDIADRLITVSVRGFDAAPLSEPVGAGLLEQATDAILAENKNIASSDG